MSKKVRLSVSLALVLLMGWSVPGLSQLSNPISARSVNYKTVFDDPYDLNQLWIMFSPLSVNASGGNLVIGYDLRTRILLGKKVQLTGSYSGPWSKSTDHTRNLATENGSVNWRGKGERRDHTSALTNRFIAFTLVELGGQFHVLDKEKKSTSKIMLTSKKARVMEFTSADYITVNSKNRHIWAGRFGGQLQGSTVALNPILKDQDLTLKADNGLTLLPNGKTICPDGTESLVGSNQLFTSMQYVSAYVGGGYMLIRNVSIKADKFGNLANNICLNAFADVMFAPNIQLANLLVQKDGGGQADVPVDGVKLNKLGFRAGFDVFYNQDLFYAFGAEAGLRPGLSGQQFYVAGRFSFPALSFKVKRNRLANQLNASQSN